MLPTVRRTVTRLGNWAHNWFQSARSRSAATQASANSAASSRFSSHFGVKEAARGGPFTNIALFTMVATIVLSASAFFQTLPTDQKVGSSSLSGRVF
jgi:hypothetical protein